MNKAKGDGGKEKAEEGGFKYLTKVRISDQKQLRTVFTGKQPG